MKQLITICCVAVCVLLIGSVLAADISKPNPDEGSPTGRSIADFLTPDGQFDLNAVRASGYQGPLGLKGIDVRVDPRGGAPTISAGSPQSPTDDPDDIYWDNSISPSIPGVNGIIYAMTVFNGKLIVGGSFSAAGGVLANGIASWDGTTWSPLGSGVGGDHGSNSINAMAVYDNRLIVGGDFATAGGDSIKYIACWDGSTWSPLGSGVNGKVNGLHVYGASLMAGGEFSVAGGDSASHIASWYGATWHSVGGGINGTVTGLAAFRGDLVAAGKFSIAGTEPANCIAAWDGVQWSALGSGIEADSVLNDLGLAGALSVFNDRLIAARNSGGMASVDCIVYRARIAAWDGENWTSLATVNRALSASISLTERVVFSAGTHVFAYDGSGWSGVGSDLYVEGSLCGTACLLGGSVNALAIFDGELVAGGGFDAVMSPYDGAPRRKLYSMATFNGTEWQPPDSGFASYYMSVQTIAEYDNNLIVGGTSEACQGIGGVSAWNNSEWSRMAGFCPRAMIVYDGKLIVAGLKQYLPESDSAFAGAIASWDGTSWSALGTGIYGNHILALTVFDNKLIVGGTFSAAGGVPASNIASWDGSAWSALGTGLDGYRVSALTVFDDKLIVGGSFSTAGGVPASNIASWDGESWAVLGTGMNYDVTALTTFSDNLIAAGHFTMAGEDSADQIASWNGAFWSPLGAGVDGHRISALTVFDNKLIVGGLFWQAGGLPTDNIASWDGSSWSPLGTGMPGRIGTTYPYVEALKVINDKLIVGGEFTTAGTKVSAGLATWTKKSPTDVGDVSTSSLPEQCALKQNYPNPFNPTTTIEYSVLKRAQVRIEIFNLLGQRLRTLVDETKSAGRYRTVWDGTDANGKVVSTGVYLYRIQAGDFVETKKMLLLK